VRFCHDILLKIRSGIGFNGLSSERLHAPEGEVLGPGAEAGVDFLREKFERCDGLGKVEGFYGRACPFLVTDPPGNAKF